MHLKPKKKKKHDSEHGISKPQFLTFDWIPNDFIFKSDLYTSILNTGLSNAKATKNTKETKQSEHE